MNYKKMIEVLESDSLLKKIVKYFGHDKEILSIILASYTKKLGEREKILLLLEDNEVEKYVNSKLKEEHSITEFSDMAKKVGPMIMELASNNDITITDSSLNTWLKHIIDGEIK
ncbi:MAG: hypothetical protein NPMRTH1_820029 [Nitrosopumilales archaeon]|nr:MAG: hypothetical protein NPMRTH1_820029 [Nitrosopumilales archaeon]